MTNEDRIAELEKENAKLLAGLREARKAQRIAMDYAIRHPQNAGLGLSLILSVIDETLSQEKEVKKL